MTPRVRRHAAVATVVALGASLTLAAPASADSVRDRQWYLSKLGIEKAWSVTKGSGVKIGIVDTGVVGSTPDLRGAVVGGKDFSGRGAPNGQKAVGGDSHGTAVASVAAGRGRSAGSGVIGSAPAAGVVSASVDLDGSGSSDVLGRAIRWLVDQHVGVITLSFALANLDPAPVSSAIGYAQQHDVVVVAASGDESKGVFVPVAPATIPGVVAVTGIDSNLEHDPAATAGRGVAIAAPFATVGKDSSDVARGIPVAVPPSDPAAPYRDESGTSFAAPIVAGVVALIRARYRDLDAANVINRLLRTATPAGTGTPNTTYGYGIVDADRAVTAANVASVSANPLGSVAPVGSSGGRSSGGRSSPSQSPSQPASPSASSSDPAVASSSSSSSGPGVGAWAGIAAAVLVVAALVGWLVARNRRPQGAPHRYPS